LTFFFHRRETNQLEPKIEHIIKSCLKREEWAQKALYGKYNVQWFMVCQRYAPNREEAKEMFQNGLVEIFSDLHQFNARLASFSTWSNRIMAHAALKHLKDLRRFDFFEQVPNQEEVIWKFREDEEKINIETVTKFIQELPTGYRAVFNLHVLEGYSHAEIAAYLGISVSTSRSQLYKAKKQLRQWLEVKL